MDIETCYICKKNIHSITDIYNHASIFKDGKNIIAYLCNYRCWSNLKNQLNHE